MKVQTIAFPSISTGVYGFPKQLAGEIAIGTVLSTLPHYSFVGHVLFVVQDSENYQIYQDILSKLVDENLVINIEEI